MIKKFISVLLLICLALPFLATPSAFAATYQCSYCGDYFDTSLALDIHEFSHIRAGDTISTLKITSCTTNADGTTTIKWSGGTAPYSVHYELIPSAPNDFWWTPEDSTYSTRYTYEHLAPDVNYRLTVKDSKGNRATRDYIDYSYTWNEIGSQIDIKPRVSRSGNISNLARFSASDIERRSSSTSYGMYVKLSYSMLARPRNYNYRFVFYAPNGCPYVWAGTLSMPSGRSTMSPWNFIDLDDFFDMLERWYYEIPIGNYEFRLYYDDVHVLTEKFYVGG